MFINLLISRNVPREYRDPGSKFFAGLRAPFTLYGVSNIQIVFCSDICLINTDWHIWQQLCDQVPTGWVRVGYVFHI